MRIGLDFDDVIFDLTSGLIEFYTRHTGKAVTFEEIDNYLWFDANLVEKFHEEHTVQNIKPIEKALESIHALLGARDELFIITDRDVKFMKKVSDWIAHHLQTDKIKITYTRGAKKSDICKEKHIGLMLEDSGKNALDCASSGITVLLFDKPWNKTYAHSNIVRVGSWEEALRKIKELREKKASESS